MKYKYIIVRVPVRIDAPSEEEANKSIAKKTKAIGGCGSYRISRSKYGKLTAKKEDTHLIDIDE